MASSRYFMCTDFHHLFENNVKNVQGVTLNSVILVYSLICDDGKNVSNTYLILRWH